jgi:hypothetical protein
MIRVYSAISNWQILAEFGANPVYILATGIIWALTGLWLLHSFWVKRRNIRRASTAMAGLYYLWYWCDRLFIQASPASNGIFALFVSTIVLLIFYLLLGISTTRTYFKTEW